MLIEAQNLTIQLLCEKVAWLIAVPFCSSLRPEADAFFPASPPSQQPVKINLIDLIVAKDATVEAFSPDIVVEAFSPTGGISTEEEFVSQEGCNVDDEFLTADAEGALGFATDADTINEILHDLCVPKNKEQAKQKLQPFLQRDWWLRYGI